MTFSDLPRFHGHDYSTSYNTKNGTTELYLQWSTNIKSYNDLSNGAVFSDFERPDPYLRFYGFKVTPFFDAEYLRNGTRYRHSFNGVLIGTYTRPTQQCNFE